MDFKNEIEEELREIAPKLASLERKHPFTIRENYFEELSSHIFLALNINMTKPDEKAASGSKEHPFLVPGNYFENLPASILSAIKEQPLQEEKHIQRSPLRTLSSNKIWLAAASVALLVVLSVWMFNRSSDFSPNTTNEFAETNIEATSDNLLLSASEVDEALIVELLVSERGEGTGNSGIPGSKDQAGEPSLMDVLDVDPQLLEEI
jgi:hypothetical protein